MITLNNTEASQQVKPISTDELQECALIISRSLKVMDSRDYPLSANVTFSDTKSVELLQSLIDSYQNLQHFWDVVGGWEGLNKLHEQHEHKVTEAEHSAVGYPYFSSDINVEYEIVKGE